MVVEAIYFLNQRSKVLICRHYRSDPSENLEIHQFLSILMQKEDDLVLTPVFKYKTHYFCWTKCNDVYLVATTKSIDCNVTLIFCFINKIIEVISEYFNQLTEESCCDNFVLIYELLDEMMDFGYPQITETKVLREYITQKGMHSTVSQVKIPAAVTNAVSWRQEGIKYFKNEVFLDVIESVNLLVSQQGHVLYHEILGTIMLNVYLSNMPELRLGLNDKFLFENQGRSKAGTVELEDVKFHQCVRLFNFERDRTISFIPPDGYFELLSYRINSLSKPLILVDCRVNKWKHSRMEYEVKARSNFKNRSTAVDVEIEIPVAHDVDSPFFRLSTGSAKYVPEENKMIWSIKKFSGGKEFIMLASYKLPSVDSTEVDVWPPIKIKFEIPYFTASGIQVRYLRIVDKSGYQALPWVRYMTKNGEYALRLKSVNTNT